MIQICESLNINILFPYLAFMVEDFGFKGDRLGYYAGFLAASFCAAQCCSSILWGLFSDNFGRKPAIIIGTLGTSIGILLFGFSSTYTFAILARMMSGFLSGNLGVVKTFVNEITDDTNRGTAISYLSVAWAVGTVLAPLAGGMLSNPVENYPFIFTNQNSIFARYPYCLPSVVCFTSGMISSLLCAIFMKETRKRKISVTTFGGAPAAVPSQWRNAYSNISTRDQDMDPEDSSHGLREEFESNQLDVSLHPQYVNKEFNNNMEENHIMDDDGMELVEIRLNGLGTRTPEEDLELYSSPQSSTKGVDGESGEGISRHKHYRLFFKCFDFNSCSKYICFLNDTSRTSDSPEENNGRILTRKEVLLSTCNYGLLCMTFIIYDETIPLLLKQDTKQGGFSFDSGEIGFIMSVTGFVWMFYTLFALPILARRSKLWLYRVGVYYTLPGVFLWPLLGLLREDISRFLSANFLNVVLKFLLITVSVLKYMSGSASFTAIMLLVNKSAEDEHLGKVNGLGQCLGSLARSIGPALGGILWSFSTNIHFLFVNFIIVFLLLLLTLILNQNIPKHMDYTANSPEDDKEKVVSVAKGWDTATVMSVDEEILEFSADSNDNNLEQHDSNELPETVTRKLSTLSQASSSFVSKQ